MALDTAAKLLPIRREMVQKTAACEGTTTWGHSHYTAGGIPVLALAVPAPGINGAACTGPLQGCIELPAASLNTHLLRAYGDLNFRQNTGNFLFDRLWHNSGIVVTTTGAQAITPAAIPARDRFGATNGDDVLAFLEVSTATTNAAATTPTISYTNQAGTAGRTGTCRFPATAVAGTFQPFELQAGDTGVRSVQSITLGTSLVTGVVHLVLGRIIAILHASDGVNTGSGIILDTSDYGPFDLGIPRLWDGTCLMCGGIAVSTSALGLAGTLLEFAQA